MSFILRITNPAGRTYTYDENGLTHFTSKYQAAVAVLRALPQIHPWTSIHEAKTIGRSLDAAPVGSPVPIPSGYKFTIEEG